VIKEKRKKRRLYPKVKIVKKTKVQTKVKIKNKDIWYLGII